MIWHPSEVHWLASIQGHLHIKIETCFSQKPYGQILQNFVCEIWVQGSENMMGWWPHNRDGRHSPEPVDRLPLTLVYSSWDSSQSWIVLALNHMSLVMRKPGFCIFENKDVDQLRGNREADQRLCFRYTDSTIPLLSKPEISSL